MATGAGSEAALSASPESVLGVLAVVERSLASLPAPSPVHGSRAEWAEVVRSTQRVVDAATAAQNAAIAQLAAIEPEELADGTEVESHRAPGHISLDAPAVLAVALNVSPGHAQRRVDLAVWLAADGPVGTDTHTGLGGLHEAMRSGRLDAYRAMVVAEELDGAPAEVRATVVAALAPYFALEDVVRLRRRCRRVLARISPDLLRQRAQRARSASALRRWAEEPGVDRWEGTFPSEEAATAWAAIDALAHEYVSRGDCATIERARAKALTDLVAGNATVRTVVTLTVPAETRPEDSRPCAARPADTQPENAEPAAARPADLHLGGTEPGAARPAGPHPDDLLEVSGLRPGDPALVPRGWVDRAVAECGREVRTVPCDPRTGALLDTTRGSSGYRPGQAVAALVRCRDGRCRFPGCSVAARFCDLDHVRPWPTGPTADDNLVALCRRHHRVKQRPGWSVRLGSDRVLSWTSPAGDVRCSEPLDALGSLVLPVTRGPGASDVGQLREPPRPQDPLPSRTLLVIPDGPHTVLEFALEHQAADVLRGPWAAPVRALDGGRCGHDSARPRAPSGAWFALAVDDPVAWPHRSSRRSHRGRPRPHPSGPPPF